MLVGLESALGCEVFGVAGDVGDANFVDGAVEVARPLPRYLQAPPMKNTLVSDRIASCRNDFSLVSVVRLKPTVAHVTLFAAHSAIEHRRHDSSSTCQPSEPLYDPSLQWIVNHSTEVVRIRLDHSHSHSPHVA